MRRRSTVTAVSALTLRRARFRSQATFVGVSREMWPGIGRERSRHGRERAEQSAEQQHGGESTGALHRAAAQTILLLNANAARTTALP